MASSTLRVALCLASLLLVSHLASAQPTPTEMLNAQRQQQVQQQRVQQQQENQRRVATRRLPAPCVVPESYYPFRTCKVSSNPRECGKGWNAWASFADCCRPGNGGAFPQGCTNFNKQVECYIPSSFYPQRFCQATTNLTRCSFNWGQWPSENECCAPGRAFPEGCTVPEPCWVGTDWFPKRKCGTTDERSTCTRGWGTYTSERECCAAGAAFTDGCGDVDAAETPTGENGEFLDANEYGDDVYAPAMDALLAEQSAMLSPQGVQAFAAAP
ncbi:hypothetical protein NADE_003515 [Nannochloris sp. 'desiccata']|nr:hypothetical protein NADE_003515 [Chlorella desiccata (nom. nud.)]